MSNLIRIRQNTLSGCPFKVRSIPLRAEGCPLRAIFPRTSTINKFNSNNINKFNFNKLEKFNIHNVQPLIVDNLNLKCPVRHFDPTLSINIDTKLNQNPNYLLKLINKSKMLSSLNKIPKFHSYFIKLSEAGAISTVTSFLILHEISAIIPLLLIWYILYQFDFDPNHIENNTYMPDFVKNLLITCNNSMERFINKKFNNNNSTNLDTKKLILTGTLSYTIVKLSYPLRILFCLWASPFCGKYLLIPFNKLKSMKTNNYSTAGVSRLIKSS
ncbi:hypothetical protein TBLA_0A00370 [Henningerozyma blattae CBS 6284]|uniref:Uncharacterized protein n=1 Tax=Henningerozyma blattae (strain ATCC 34711 / CBS 6284 / DSM 70876 / NBRC 10599 / NRRL Y-10934 / UCD 77-7) TaxID=1071380 RepID=I2GUN5_HENB6|nr:hypothetical protein TBLA_0A00370 [Tetrapisispora blattae CBS 6284]CCH57837.1 hypothetical protein TBLA_0A00370 [Tetrapisispora blattae CBS 6284]